MKQTELAQATGKSLSTVKRTIDALQKTYRLRRINGKRYVAWEVLVPVERQEGELYDESVIRLPWEDLTQERHTKLYHLIPRFARFLPYLYYLHTRSFAGIVTADN